MDTTTFRITYKLTRGAPRAAMLVEAADVSAALTKLSEFLGGVCPWSIYAVELHPAHPAGVMSTAATAWTFDGYWRAVIGDMTADAAVEAFDLGGGDFRGFSEWLGATEYEAWRAGGLPGDLCDAWGAFHDKAARMLMDAAHAVHGAA